MATPPKQEWLSDIEKWIRDNKKIIIAAIVVLIVIIVIIKMSGGGGERGIFFK